MSELGGGSLAVGVADVEPMSIAAAAPTDPTVLNWCDVIEASHTFMPSTTVARWRGKWLADLQELLREIPPGRRRRYWTLVVLFNGPLFSCACMLRWIRLLSLDPPLKHAYADV
jgi:hypothetical protein